MIKLICFFWLYICFYPLFGQISQEKVDVTFEVRSGVDKNQVVKGAIVDLKGFADKPTNNEGKAIFLNVPIGNYRYSIYHQNYQYKFPDNTFKITSQEDCGQSICCNCVYENLLPRPSTSFYVQGKIVDSQNNPLEDADVRFQYSPLPDSDKIQFNSTTITDEWGHYSFEFINEEVKLKDAYEIEAKKNKYQTNSKTNLSFNNNSMDLKNLILYNIPSSLKEPKVPFVYFEVSTETGFFTNSKNSQFHFPLPGLQVRFNLTGEKQNLLVGIGWHFPYELETVGSFETLAGQESEIRTIYKISSSPGLMSIKYYGKFNNRMKYFVDLSGRFDKIEPDPPLLSEDQPDGEIEEVKRFVPKINAGIAFNRGFLNIEPYLSFSYISLDSQNFNFNYFGRADSLDSNLNFVQFSLGINILVNIIGLKE